MIGDEHGGQPLGCALWHPAGSSSPGFGVQGALAQVLGF